MGSFLQDLRYGVRTLIKDRAFLFTAVLALALGIGSTTAIFSVIDNVLLEPFPYTDGQRLMAIMIHDKSSSDSSAANSFNRAEFLDYQEQNHVFDRSIGLNRRRADDGERRAGILSRRRRDRATRLSSWALRRCWAARSRRKTPNPVRRRRSC